MYFSENEAKHTSYSLAWLLSGRKEGREREREREKGRKKKRNEERKRIVAENLEKLVFVCHSGNITWDAYCRKEVQPGHWERDQPWDFFGGNDAEAETPVLWPPHVKS